MKILIIDDEQDARINLLSFISRYIPEAQQIEQAKGVEDGRAQILAYNPDVIFLDVEMKDGTGFDLLKYFHNPAFKIVFTTGFDHYALMAFKFSAVDYLLKPIDPDDFEVMVKKLRKKLNIVDIDRRISHLEQLVLEGSFQRMALPYNDGIMYISLDEIVHLVSDGNYTTVHTLKDQKIMVTRIIKEFEDMLPSNNFYRTHKSHIVNLKYIERFKRSDESVVMRTGELIPVARRRKEKLLGRLG